MDVFVCDVVVDLLVRNYIDLVDMSAALNTHEWKSTGCGFTRGMLEYAKCNNVGIGSVLPINSSSRLKGFAGAIHLVEKLDVDVYQCRMVICGSDLLIQDMPGVGDVLARHVN